MALGRYGRIGIAPLAAAFGVLSLAAARHDPSESFAGRSTLGGIAELGAGLALVAAGLLFWARHRRNRFGPLLTAAGFAWFLPEWNNPGTSTAFGFTAGLVGLVACVPLVAHAALAYPTGRLRSRLEAVVLAGAYAGALLLLGLLPATVFDTKAAGCLECPRNLVLTRGDAGLVDTFNRSGLQVGLGWLAALGVLLVWRLLRSSRTVAALVLPALVPATAYLGLVAWDFQHSLGRGFLTNDSFDRRLWRYEAVALAAFAFAVGWALLRERQARASVSRLIVELGRMPRPGAVRDALAHTLGDLELELAYRRADTGGYIDAFGRPVDLDPGAGRAVTPLLRGEATVAALVHDRRLLDQPGLLQEVLAAARIGVEHEQLQAEVRAQLQELQASRARIVETSDAERRRLERDLHDGAQQRIVSLSLALQLLRSQLGPEPDPDAAKNIAAAAGELQTALAELRELAHGIYPAVLADEGLAAAVETLVELAEVPIEIESLLDERLPAAVENAAYFTVLEAVKGAADASVSVERSDGVLLVRVRSRRTGADPDHEARLIEIGDRVGALDGRLRVVGEELRAEIPCASSSVSAV